MAKFTVETNIGVECQVCGESLDVEWFEDEGRLEVETCTACIEEHVPDLFCGECGSALDVQDGEHGVIVTPCPTCTNEIYNKGHADAENKE